MNVLPNSSTTNSSSSSVTSLILTTSSSATTTTTTPATIIANVGSIPTKQPPPVPPISDQNNRSVILNCAVCKNSLLNNNNENSTQNGGKNPYRMLAVRPTIGSGSKDPFFPILETLTHTSAAHVACCWRCSDSLLEQWFEYEMKNVLIKNRDYNLPTSSSSTTIVINNNHNSNNSKSQSCLSLSTTTVVDNHNDNLKNKNETLTSFSSCTNSNTVSTTPMILAHPISLSNPLNSLHQQHPTMVDCSSSNSATPSPQDEVLDLSMTSSTVKTETIPVFSKATEFIVIPSITPPAAASTTATTTNLTTNKQTITTNAANLPGSRQRKASISTSSSGSENNVLTISPYLNSSMTNLIKVSSSPVAALSLKPLLANNNNNIIEAPANVNNSSNNSSTSTSPVLAKKPLLSCSLCNDQCPTLYSIMLRPMGNCPYFPSLRRHVKMILIDSSGKTNVCESCHHQLILQWDAHQKSNKPISERQYHLVRSSNKHNINSNPSTIGQKIQPNPETVLSTNSSVPVNNNSQNSIKVDRNSIPPISQSFVSIVAANKTFICVMCGKDLIQNASSSSSSSSSNNSLNSNSSTSHIAFSIQTENDTTGNVITKKLIIQSAQEINLLPFLSTSTSLHLHQLQLLHESGRVLICALCFETISSRCNASNINSSNSDNSNFHEQTNQSKTTTPLNDGPTPTKIINPQHNDDQSLLCCACKHHKYQYMVETKENCQKKPFFPFLHDPNNDDNSGGKARLCAACHLMLETQWDAYENSYVPYNQRIYRLPTTTNSQSTLITTTNSKRPPLSGITTTSGHNISSPQTQIINGNGGQQVPPSPLKIQIAVPSVPLSPSSSLASAQPIIVAGSGNVNLSSSSEHLLLTTVNQQTLQSTAPQPINNVLLNDFKNDQRILKLMNELLANLGGPHPTIKGDCSICQQHSPAGQTYQVFSTSRNIVISAELGIYPYFPMLKLINNNNNNVNKKNLKNSQDNNNNPYMACTYCYHSLIAQWIAYHVSPKPEDRDLSQRHYNCRDFVCYVCGVTTYRQFVRSITIKDFPFLVEHKRPPGSLTINKGESVITCLTCYQTLTHQWIENERMKVPLEMRKYNWMAVPPPPPPTSTTTSASKNEQSEHKLFVLQRHSNSIVPEQRTIIPILANTSTLPYQIHANAINHNGIISVPASGATVGGSIIPKAIIVNTTGNMGQFQQSAIVSGASIAETTATTNNIGVVAPTFNPSHTLAPLVAAAMAATPVTIKQEANQQNDCEPIMATNMAMTTVPVNSGASTIGTNTNSFADVLRQLARQQHITIHKINDQTQIPFNAQQQPMQQESVLINNTSNNSRSGSSSINLTTLASVAALAGGNNRNNPPQFVQAAFPMNTHDGSKHQEISHSELPKAVINSNSFAIHFNALSNNNQNNHYQHSFNNNGKMILAKKVDDNEQQNCIRKNVITIVNNAHHHQHHLQENNARNAQILELEEVTMMNDSKNHDKSSSKVNLEVIKLRNKRIAQLKKLKEDKLRAEQQIAMVGSSSSVAYPNPKMEDEIDENDHCAQQDFSSNSFDSKHNHPKRGSLVKFLGNVLPVLPLKEKRAEDKTNFLSLFGLATHRAKRERELDSFVQRKLNRRLSEASYQVDWLQQENEEERILKIDSQFESFRCGAYFSSSNITPESGLKTKPKQSLNIDKTRIIDALSLEPCSLKNYKQLKTEMDWLAVLRDRQFRRKRGIICVGKTYNNLNDQVLKTWLPQLSSKVKKSNPELIERIEKFLSLDWFEQEDKKKETLAIQNVVDESTSEDAENAHLINHNQQPIKMDSSSLNPIKTISRNVDQPEKRIFVGMNYHPHQIVTSISLDNQTPNHLHPPQPQPPPSSHNHQIYHENSVTIVNSVNNSNNGNNKIIDTKQFAQEFHESVLLETQKQMNNKHNGCLLINNTNGSANTATIIQQPDVVANLTNAQPTIIYSDHLRPSLNDLAQPNIDPQHHQLNHHSLNHFTTDHNGMTIMAPTTTIITTPMKDNKMNIKEQILKLQVRIQEIGQEHKMWNEKKNEIIGTMQKLDNEKTFLQTELDRLTNGSDL